MNFLSLVDQISKYRNQYWENISHIFEEIPSLNINQGISGKDGLVNYYFFTLLEMIGGILLENKAFKLLHSLLAVKRWNYTKDGMEPILDWKTRANFIEVKKEEEAKERGQNGIFPCMYYLLQLIESQEIPFEYNLRGRIFDVDLLFFVYTVIHPMGQRFPYWSPQSSVYSREVSSDLFKKIRYDKTFGNTIANDLFGIGYRELVRHLGEAKEIFEERVEDSFHMPFIDNPFQDF
jgi:hypothetical protein